MRRRFVREAADGMRSSADGDSPYRMRCESLRDQRLIGLEDRRRKCVRHLEAARTVWVDERVMRRSGEPVATAVRKARTRSLAHANMAPDGTGGKPGSWHHRGVTLAQASPAGV